MNHRLSFAQGHNKQFRQLPTRTCRLLALRLLKGSLPGFVSDIREVSSYRISLLASTVSSYIRQMSSYRNFALPSLIHVQISVTGHILYYDVFDSDVTSG